MSRRFAKVAVLGSGVMGSAIAAHFANAGVPSLVLDIVPPKLGEKEKAAGLTLEDPRFRNGLAALSVKALLKARPAPLFVPQRLGLIETGNLEDHLPRLAEADWVIEVVKEDLEIKKRVLAAAAEHLKEGAVLSSNTSGLSLAAMSAALPEKVRPRFLGTHFFNPPRYMRLIEMITTEETDPEVAEAVSAFATRRLGKGVVPAEDTPNFIANRIGVHSLMVTLRVMKESGLSIEEIDALTGPALGRPKTATFRLADLVGIDTLLLVAQNVTHNAPDDESLGDLAAAELLKPMVEKGLLGLKTGAGFYRKVKKPEKKILTLDPEKGEYRDPIKPRLPELAELRGAGSAAERIRLLVGGEGAGSKAAWKILGSTLSYAAMRLGEIAGDADTIDRALRLGFNWELGPFETWDALGFRATTERLRADGLPLPAWVDDLYEAGAESLYQEEGGERLSPTAVPGSLAPAPRDPRALPFAVLHREGREVQQNPSASLLDLGDGVLALEFHSKMNVVDGDIIAMIHGATAEAEANGRALVVANDGDNFSAGANLMLLLGAAMKGEWEAIEKIVRGFQSATNALERCAVPVVVAPHGMALGGGCEIVLAGNAVHAAAESYIGLVEVGAGVIPAGGGCLRYYRRHVEGRGESADPYEALKASFMAIGTARVSTSAEEARGLGFLRPADGWSMNREHLLLDAKDVALGLAGAGFTPPAARGATIPVLGRSGVALVDSVLVNMHEGRQITDHDRTIGRELGRILCGGDLPGPTTVSEQHLLDLECEAFLRLCGEKKTLQRMEALLKTGKPLRN
jgi:3-hydroxyacyl-CoA dehydrogenase